MENFQNDVETTVDRISTIQKERLKSGDAFNVFDILDLSSKDKHTHSAFIAELLDPQGRHNQKDKFLKLFLSVLNITETLDTENAKVTKDKSIGEVDWNEMTGGQIDIVVEFQNPKFAVIIENKIVDADDKQAYLLRSKKFAERNYPDAYKLFYLTVDGQEPRDYSTYCKEMSLGKYWQCISYNNEIKNKIMKFVLRYVA